MNGRPLQFLLLLFAGWVNRKQVEVLEYLKEENRVLREQPGGRRLRFTDEQRRRLAVRGRVLERKVLSEVTGLLTPDTILHWYCQLIATKYDGSARRGAGRPRTAQAIEELVVKFAMENVGWGYTRLRDALGNLGLVIGRNTIKRILREHGLEPAPERSKRMPWKAFIKAHLGAIAAIDIQTRRVHLAGIVRQANGAWMKQVGRNLSDGVDGFLKGMRYLIHDRDPLFTGSFRTLLRGAGVECIRLPAHSPNLNAYAERFVLSIKSECLNRLVLLGEQHLRRAVTEFVEHYHGERNHQGLENRLLTAAMTPSNDRAPIVRRERLGGILNYYYRSAA